MEQSKSDNLFFKKLANSSIYFLGLFLIALALWTQKFFGIVTIDQATSTVNFGIEGAFAADSVFIKRFIEWCIVWPAILTVCLVSTKSLFANSNIINKINRHYYFLILGFLLTAHQFSLLDFFHGYAHQEDYFQANYLNPKSISFKNAHPKNLVLIYVESLEATYGNKKIFGHDLLHSLNNFRQGNNFSFANYTQMPGTGWTIAGIVGTQCGVPLKQLTIFNGNRMGENVKNFLPNADCLSDILAAHGYKNIFMNGASSKIGGKFTYFHDHHYAEIYGKEEWLKQGFKPSAVYGWGLSDHDLFQQAKHKMAQLMAEKQPFNLTILTVDTHGFTGQLTKFCQQQGYHDFSGIVECTGTEVADFITYIKKQHWSDRVNIVVLGDHMSMQNTITDKLESAPDRSIFNLFISNQKFYKNFNEITEFDMLPTILRFIGFNFNSNKLALGYSGIGDGRMSRPPTYVSDTQKFIGDYSKSYAELWLEKMNTNTNP